MEKNDSRWLPSKNVDNSYSAAVLINQSLGVGLPNSEGPALNISSAITSYKYVQVPPDPLPHSILSGHQATMTASESARPSGRIAVSERTASQPDRPNTYPDYIGTIEVRPQTERGVQISKRERADWVPEVIRDFGVFVVGTGPVKDSRCGRFMPLQDDSAGACPNKPNDHKPLLLPIGCTRRECREDWSRWANKDARRLSNIVNGYLNAKFKNQAQLIPGFVPRYLPDHISIHPSRSLVVELVRRTRQALEKKGIIPSDYMASAEFHRIFKKKYEYEEQKALQVLGLKAAVSFYHPVRLRKDQDEYAANLMYDAGRYRKVLDRDDWVKHVKFSVHSHVITDGSFLMNSDEFYEKTGWTYRNHREIDDIERLAKYLLSHASAVPGRHSVRYLGDYQKLNVEGVTKVETFIACPECVKEGERPEDSTYVVGKILDIVYERDQNHKNQMVEWTWGDIYSHKYVRRTRIIPVFRLRPFGQARIPIDRDEKGRPVTYERHVWDKLPEDIQRVTRWIEHFSDKEWISLPDDDKPRWWV